ncbi:MAG: tetratricopeptide repeat protein [Candidatus Kapabacteria bacterium]|nr:tetratricopeptide repeat protein [Candidatus Kapabacteria bacterium]
MSLQRLSFIVLAIALITSTVTAQQSLERDNLRMAQTYERNGDFRNAARLYQELYAQSPKSELYFQGVVRSLSGLQQFASLVPMVDERMRIAPSVTTAILAGTLNAQVGKLEKAQEWWAKAIELSDDDETTNLLIGAEQSQLLLHKQALASYLAARKIDGESTSYGDEISQLYAINGDLEAATKEALAVYATDGDLVRLQRRLSVLLSYEKGPALVGSQLDGMASSSPDVLRLQQWFYRQTKSWQRALTVTAKLDAMSNPRGQELLLFADAARMEEQFDISIAAYGMIMKEAPDKRYHMSAAYGSARALEQKLRGSKSISPVEARAIVARYDEIIDQYAQHPIAAEALYQSAILEDDVIGNMDAARERLMRLQNQWRGTTVSSEGALRLADIYLVMGKDRDAETLLHSIVNGPSVIVTDRREMASLRLADLAFWRGELDSAQALYKPLAANIGSDASNDALDHLLLIDLAQEDSASVVSIAIAEGLIIRRRYREGAIRFADAAKSATDSELRDRARMNAAKAYFDLQEDETAEPLLREIIANIPDTIYGDRALSLLADHQVRIGDKQGALQTLNSLLVHYPRSILVPTVRDRIRVLRGDA